jgi:putative redox protein
MIEARRKSGYSTLIRVDAHTFVSDVDPSLGGTDEGPDPHELIEAALGACTSITVQMYANRKGWKLESCNARVKFVREDREAIVLERVVEFTGDLDEAQTARLFEIAEKCPIHGVLSRGAKIETRRGAV